MAVAPLVAGWRRTRRGSLPSPSRGVSRPGVPFMQDTLGGDARLIVEIGWGADLTADAATWTWTDVTTDVQQANGQKIKIRIGRGDEASVSQPASCAMQLDNRAGLYSQGGQSANWPNVRRNTPVRVRADLGSGPFVLFQGFTNGFTPDWDVTGTNAIVRLSASGVLRRLHQGATPAQSTFRAGFASTVAQAAANNLVAYWPVEELKNATSIASGFSGHPPMSFTGSPTFESSTVFDCSDALPLVNGSTWVGVVPAYTTTNQVDVRILGAFPDAGLTNGAVLYRVLTTGSIARWDLVYGTGGTLALNGYGPTGTSIVASGAIAFAADGQHWRVSIYFKQNGSNVDWAIQARAVNSIGAGTYTGTANTQTVESALQVIIDPNGDVQDLAVGHVTVYTAAASIGSTQLDAYKGETVTARLQRLCDDNDVSLSILGTSTVTMGPQLVDTLVNLLRECETADQGLLCDGLGPGLTYIARVQRENAVAALTVNATGGELPMPFAPVDDDQVNRNKVKATRKKGSNYVYQDSDGPLGTDTIGTYDEEITINSEDDSLIGNYASWLVHLGTVDGYRYPTMSLDLAKAPHLAPVWLLTNLSGRIDTTNIEDVRTQHPEGTLAELLEGYSQSIDQFRWDITANCSNYQPWKIGVVAEDTGDTAENLVHGESDGATITAAADAGATSLTVATPSGPLWTTTADDCPFYIDLGGIKVNVTAISGASSPQTFTVDAVSLARPAGAAVSIWNPPVVGL